jgi:hypothetical protein
MKLSVDSASKDIEDWVLNFLSKPNEAFAGLPPCPYAKRAWLLDKVIVRHIHSRELELSIKSAKDKFPEDKDVMLFCVDPDSITPKEIVDLCVSTDDFVLLEDHPETVEEIQGVVLNQGKYAMVFMQRRSELTIARAELAHTNYYKNWPVGYKKDILSR